MAEQPAPGRSSDAPFQLLPGFPIGAGQQPTGATPAPGPPNGQPVFMLGGDGPPQAASNTVAGQGRRLRRQRWGFWSVVGVLLLAAYLYNEFIAPTFGLPVLLH